MNREHKTQTLMRNLHELWKFIYNPTPSRHSTSSITPLRQQALIKKHKIVLSQTLSCVPCLNPRCGTKITVSVSFTPQKNCRHLHESCTSMSISQTLNPFFNSWPHELKNKKGRPTATVSVNIDGAKIGRVYDKLYKNKTTQEVESGGLTWAGESEEEQYQLLVEGERTEVPCLGCGAIYKYGLDLLRMRDGRLTVGMKDRRMTLGLKGEALIRL